MWVAVLGHISLYQLGRIADPLSSDIPESLESVSKTAFLNSTAQAIRYYRQVSTQSVKNYTFTQNKKWEQNYKVTQAKFDSIINEALDNGGEEDKRLVSNINEAHLALSKMESTAVELVNNGKVEEAIKIFENSKYLDEKENYEQYLEDYVNRSTSAHDEALMSSARTVSFALKRAQDLTKSSRRLVYLFTIIALGLALGSGLLIARSIYVPLWKLRDATVEIGKGKLDTRIEIKSGDEIASVVASFDKMTDDLKQTTTSMDNLIREITDRKKAEKNAIYACNELEKANRELKEIQSQLVQNEKLASIGQLAAGVAHELNTPIGSVASNFETLEGYVTKMRDLLQMYCQLIGDIEASEKSEVLDKAAVINRTRNSMRIDFILDDIAGLFDDSREGLKRVTNIVKTLRDFSRVDQLGSHDIYNINDGVKTTLIVVTNEVKYDIDVEAELSEVPPVICNAGQINQVLLNLLINAAQAIKSHERNDKGKIKIRTYTTNDDVVCEISDNGPGIGPDCLPHIFDPFFTTKPVGQGTGLGLSISYDIIVTKHKGNLLVDSSLGKGTQFTMKLPIHRKKEENKCERTNHGGKNRVICG
jgi:signal transduction histidine kinase